MSSNKNRFWIYTLVVFLQITSSLCAQNSKKMDSIIKTANNEIYIKPDNAIKGGQLILKLAGNNVDYKIRGFKLISDAYSSKRDYEKSVEYLVKASELIDLSNDLLLKINIVNKTGI